MKFLNHKFALLLILAVSFVTFGCSDDSNPIGSQNIKATGQVSGTWTAGSVVYIDSTVVIPAGKSLTIEEGVKVIVGGSALKTDQAPEIQVRGNLYVYGTANKPVIFTIADSLQSYDNKYDGWWGGIQCASTAGEVAIEYATIEYLGAPAGANSIFVEQGEAQGDPRFGIIFGNNTGKLYVGHSTIRYTQDDALRVTGSGGTFILEHNTFAFNGETGGEAMNIKSGSSGEMAYNLIYSCATNGTKWSNSGDVSPQTNCDSYNNTMINCGWRRSKEGRGGSVNIEKAGRGQSYNNMIVNCRYGTRVVGGADIADTLNTQVDNNYYYGNEELIVSEFYPSNGIWDHSHSPNDNISNQDPMFVNYAVSTGKFDDNANYTSLNFHLKSGSPALTGGKTGFTLKVASMTMNGKTYSAPQPSSYIGAFGTN